METVNVRIPRYWNGKVFGKTFQIDFKDAPNAEVVKALFYKCGGVGDKGTGAAKAAREKNASEKAQVAAGWGGAQDRCDAIMGRNGATWNSHGTREAAIGDEAAQFFATLRKMMRETARQSSDRIVAYRKNADVAKVAAATDYLSFRGKKATKADVAKVAERMWNAAVAAVAERAAQAERDDAEFLIDIDAA